MTPENPKVSAIVPIYNAEPWLPRCLDSLIGQTLRDMEILLIDDGSTDKSGEIADEYASRDDRIKVVHQKNGGAAAARNAGLEIARGEYIGFLDSDDYLWLDFYEKLYEAAKQSGADIAKGEGIKIELDGTRRPKPPFFEQIEQNRAHFNDAFWSAVFRREFLQKNKLDFPVGIITAQDTVFITKAALLANKVEFVRGTFHVYCKREGSLDSARLPVCKIKSKTDAVMLVIDFLNKTPNIRPEWHELLFTGLVSHLIKNVFSAADSEEGRRMLVDDVMEIYARGRKEYYLDKEFAEFLKLCDKPGLYAYLVDLQKKGKKPGGLPRLWRHIRGMKF
jgi:glycosyltransferase involved in cell wall biosynthesis